MNYQKEKRPIDESAEETYSWLKKKIVFMKKTRVKTWQGTIILAFVIGMFSYLILSIETDTHIASRADGETASLALSPTVVNVEIGDTFVLNILLNTDSNNAVVARAIVNYDADSFSLTNWNINNSVFDSSACASEGKTACEIVDDTTNGVIDITLAKPSPGVNSSSGLIAALTFQALRATTENITISFTSGSYSDSDVIFDGIGSDGAGTDILNSVTNTAVTITAPTCASFTYSGWSVCQPDSTQSRTVASSSPSGCVGGNPVLTQSCVYDGGGGSGGGGETTPDTIPPNQPANFTAAAADSQIVLTWTNPQNSDFAKIKILRKEGSVPTSHNDPSALIVYEGTGEEYADIELGNDTAYHYAIFAYDDKSNYSSILTISAQPIAGKTPIIEMPKSICLNIEANNLFGLDSAMTDCISLREAKIVNGHNKHVELGSADKQLYQRIVSAEEQANLELNFQYSLAYFIQNHTATTKILGAGERAGVINSYRSAFNKLPTAKSDWQDVIKIANGRWPADRSETAENRAKQEFKTVYLREPDMDNPNDNAAVTVIAYGLRPANRNMDSEKAAIKIFKNIYDFNPSSAVDWDITRAIAYSGAKR